ncbi:hypothetical protein PR002_g687 [Phytophthora rubi]|uniref:Uncharacterized protein n=1 Tax=Phytophthora rubi TaxID=129364 RepID=A0A6A3P4X4_9STRA|nr:hypothetical protein PR002_g687 [Phytophthora rubi]
MAGTWARRRRLTSLAAVEAAAATTTAVVVEKEAEAMAEVMASHADVVPGVEAKG